MIAKIRGKHASEALINEELPIWKALLHFHIGSKYTYMFWWSDRERNIRKQLKISKRNFKYKCLVFSI